MSEPKAGYTDPGYMRLRYLSFLQSLIGGTPISVHLAEIQQPLSALLDIWCPEDVINCGNSKFQSSGVLCVKNLKTFLGLISKARLREFDVVAVEVHPNDN